MSRDHRKREAFQIADQQVIAVYTATRPFPIEERFGLQAQLRRAAVSVPTNMVEGCARSSDAEYCRFLEIALGSAREMAYLINLARRLDYIGPADALRIEDRYGAVQGKLHRIIEAIAPTRKP